MTGTLTGPGAGNLLCAIIALRPYRHLGEKRTVNVTQDYPQGIQYFLALQP